VLMIDARNVFRKVTRKIYDFSPEQLRNLTAIVWLYRGEKERFEALLEEYHDNWRSYRRRLDAVADKVTTAVDEFPSAFKGAYLSLEDETEQESHYQQVHDMADASQTVLNAVKSLTDLHQKRDHRLLDTSHAYPKNASDYRKDLQAFRKIAEKGIGDLKRKLEKPVRSKLESKWVETSSVIHEVDQSLRQSSYWSKQVEWLESRFPDHKFVDVEGLCKAVSQTQIETADWSLTPGRYVGVAPEEEDEDFDFEQTMRDIHGELADLNEEAAALAAKIQENFEGLAV